MANVKDTPETIECSAQPFDLSFHPQLEHLVAAALVDGTLEVHDFSPTTVSNDDSDDENDTIISSIPVHTQLKSAGRDGSTKQASCRAVRFSQDGAKIYTGGSAGDICALNSERACTLSTNTKKPVTWRVSTGPHGIHVLYQLPEERDSLLVTGDEQGTVSFWDQRSATQKPVMSWKENTDYISGFDYHDHTLLASSADCTLSAFDLRKPRAEILKRSDDQEDELLSVCIMKHGKKVVCGTQEGVLAVWSWGTWGDISDRFPGHPSSIDALLKVDEDTLLTGNSDGLVRLVQIHPDKLLGVLGDHDGYPIEKLEFNANRNFVGSVSHDSLIRLFDAAVLRDDMDEDSESDEDEGDQKVAPVASKPAAAGHGSDDEWDDMEDEDDSDVDDSDDESSDEDNKATTNDKRAGRLKTENEKFFEDL